MKIVGIVGSPNRNGSTATIVREIFKGAQENNHEFTEINVYDKKINPCVACRSCKAGKVDICVHKDDFDQIAKQIIDADVIIFGSPVYFGQITGPAKNFIDRMYTFVADYSFNIRYLQEKKFITVITSGASGEYFASVTDYLNYWFGEFFKMNKFENIKAGDLTDVKSLEKHPEILEKAFKIGKSI